MTATAHQTFSVLYYALSGGSFWRVYVAFSLVCIAGVVVFFPKSGFGVERFASIARYYRLSPAAQARFERALAADYPDRRRSRRAEYTCAFLCLILAALCAVPAVPPAVTFAVGILAGTAAAAYGWARRQAQGMRRGAALAQRKLPGPLLLIGICGIVAMLVYAIDPALRAGSLLVAGAIGGMLLIARGLSTAPLSFRGDDPALEAALANFVRADQLLTIASLMTTVTMLCSSLVITLAPHHPATATIALALIRFAATLPVIVAAIALRWVVKLRDFKPLAIALEHSPA